MSSINRSQSPILMFGYKRIIDPAQVSGVLIGHQNVKRLAVGNLRPVLDLRRGATANRVLHQEEGIVGQAQHARDVFRCHLKRFGTEYQGALAKLLEGNAVMQTARRTGPSIAQAGDQEIRLRRGVAKCFRWSRRAGVGFVPYRQYGAAMPLFE